jgi:Gpi18-like mannosyltransferase
MRPISAFRTVPRPDRVWFGEAILIGALIVLAGAIRIAGRSYVTYDMNVFLQWYDELRAHGGLRGLRYPIGNYNAPFLYFLVLALYLPGATVIKLKLIFAAFDAGVVYFTYRLVALRYPGWRIPTLAALVVAFLPTVVVNASMWGQCDSMYATFALGGLYFLLRERPWWGCAFLGVSFAFKPQAILIFPLLLLLVLAGRVPWRSLIALPVTFLVLDLPAWLLGRDLHEMLTIYSSQLNNDELTANAPTVFQYLPVTQGQDPLRKLAYLLAVVLALTVCLVLIRTYLSAERIVTAATFFVLAIPFLLPRMHDRYFYLADLLSVVLAFYRPRLWYVPLLVQVSSSLSYLPYLFGDTHGPYVSFQVTSAFMLAAILVVGYALLADVPGALRVDDGSPPETRADPMGRPRSGLESTTTTADAPAAVALRDVRGDASVPTRRSDGHRAIPTAAPGTSVATAVPQQAVGLDGVAGPDRHPEAHPGRADADSGSAGARAE